MTVRRRGAVTRGRAPGRTSWSRTVTTGAVTVPAGTKAVLFTLALANPGISETIMRTRVFLDIASDQSGVEPMSGALGFIVVNDLAIAVGATAIPGPATDASDDGWFLWKPFGLRGGNSGGGIISLPLDIDSKAMRRVDEGFGIAVMIENANASTGFIAGVSFSILSKRV